MSSSSSASARSSVMRSAPTTGNTAVGSVAAWRSSIAIRPARWRSAAMEGSRTIARAAASTIASYTRACAVGHRNPFGLWHERGKSELILRYPAERPA